jgi:hypothetical protein
MIEEKKLEKWSDSYWDHIKRNIGIFTSLEQEKLRSTPIIIFGVGGLGGPLAECLVRSGCETISICDNDKFERSNLNRQICSINDLGKFKVDVVKEFLKKINPNVKIKKYYEVSQSNIDLILEGAEIVSLTLDDPFTSIMIARKCADLNIPLVESFGFPYLCAWWFSPNSISYEKFYNLGTDELSLDTIKSNKNIINKLREQIFKFLLKFPRIKEIYDREEGILEKMLAGKLPIVSVAPFVRLSAIYLAIEIIFTSIINIKRMITVPEIIGFDYIRMHSFSLNLNSNKKINKS